MILQTYALTKVSLEFLITILTILGNTLFIITGVTRRNKTENNKNYHLFAIAGSINLLWLLFLPPLFDLFYQIGGTADLPFWILNIIISGIISIVTYGIIITLLGIKDSTRYGKAIKFTGFFWFVAGILDLTFILMINSYLYIDVPAPDETIEILAWIIFYIGIALNIAAGSFLLAYTVELGEKYLGIAALFFILRGFIYAIKIIYVAPII